MLTTYSCIIYPEDGSPSFTLPNCTPRRTDEESNDHESDEISSGHFANINSMRAVSQLLTHPSPETIDKRNDSILSEPGAVAHNAATYSCPRVYGNFCLSASVILRCHKHIGRPENCNNALVGGPPGDDASCWETSSTSGDAACSKK